MSRPCLFFVSVLQEAFNLDPAQVETIWENHCSQYSLTNICPGVLLVSICEFLELHEFVKFLAVNTVASQATQFTWRTIAARWYPRTDWTNKPSHFCKQQMALAQFGIYKSRDEQLREYVKKRIKQELYIQKLEQDNQTGSDLMKMTNNLQLRVEHRELVQLQDHFFASQIDPYYSWLMHHRFISSMPVCVIQYREEEEEEEAGEGWYI